MNTVVRGASSRASLIKNTADRVAPVCELVCGGICSGITSPDVKLQCVNRRLGAREKFLDADRSSARIPSWDSQPNNAHNQTQNNSHNPAQLMYLGTPHSTQSMQHSTTRTNQHNSHNRIQVTQLNTSHTNQHNSANPGKVQIKGKQLNCFIFNTCQSILHL